jgi:hypothetical protein
MEDRLVYWAKEEVPTGHVSHFNWHLMVRDSLRSKKWRRAATVWANGVWHTWDRKGSGGENWREDTVKQAKIEAAASAIAQGFI